MIATKEQYLQLRPLLQVGNINVALLFQFWEETKKPVYPNYSIEEFEQLVQIYLQHNGDINRTSLLNYFDNKFTIVKVLDKNQQTIKIM